MLVQFAGERALKLAALGVSPTSRALFEQAGLRALYMGDEAIVDTERFSLEGRPIRKVRQSVSRLRKAGYRTAIARARLARRGRRRAARADRERLAARRTRARLQHGDGLAPQPAGREALVVYATDDRGVIRGFLHFVPTYGRDAVSLSFMRRQHDTPNGLTEFLIVEAIEHLRARGVSEVSLNFAAFARFIRQPTGVPRADARPRPRPGRHVVSDRASLPLQRQVLPSLGAALLHVRAPLRPAARGYRCALARGSVAETEDPQARPGPRASEGAVRGDAAGAWPRYRFDGLPTWRAIQTQKSRQRNLYEHGLDASLNLLRRGRLRARCRTTRRREGAWPQPQRPKEPTARSARCSSLSRRERRRARRRSQPRRRPNGGSCAAPAADTPARVSTGSAAPSQHEQRRDPAVRNEVFSHGRHAHLYLAAPGPSRQMTVRVQQIALFGLAEWAQTGARSTSDC